MSTPSEANNFFGSDKTSLLILNQVVNSSREIIILTDKKGVITFINPQFTKLYGYTAEEVVGKRTPLFLSVEYINSDYATEY
ncbi:MAG: PAS domain S-box protein [Spirochaetales bacterium]|nr:PAS domain S-box protein [Spirochaetales bacterium]